MRTLTMIASLTLTAALSAAPVPKELKEPPDPERLKGVWVVVQGDTSTKGYRWTFEGEKLFAGGTADAKGIEYGFVIRSGVTPRELDISRDGHAAYRGIYKFVGDELHIAYHGSDRPDEFSAAAGGRHLHVLRRLSEVKK